MQRDAVRFITAAMQDKELRCLCYSAQQGTLAKALAAAGYTFTLPEFDDAVLQQLFVCRDEDEADNIKQFGLWFRQLSAAE